MSYGLARIGDTVQGNCNGDYQVYEQTGTTPIVENPDGSTSGGEPIYGWVTYNENGTASGTISTGSSIILDKVTGNGFARITDTVAITKTYAHSNHLDSLNIIGTINQGSVNVYVDNLSVAYIGCTVTASNCSGLVITTGSADVVCNG